MIEILAKASHRTWSNKRQEEGWVWGLRRLENDEIKTNPDIRSFDELTEAQKSYSREEARTILKTILDEGYSIVK